MARLRLLGSVLYYLTILYGYHSAWEWVDPSALDSIGGRAGFLFIAIMIAPLLFLISEGRRGLRHFVLDSLLGDRHDH